MIKFNTIPEALSDIREGKVVIVVDDEDRENEGDFVVAAEKITPEIINFMATYGRGLICTPILEERAKELNLKLMQTDNTSNEGTAFTVSIDLISKDTTTGISAFDRAKTIQALIDKNISAKNFAKPGHIFPLIAKEGGVLRRAGHTEAGVDLSRLAGLYPASVIVEILNSDGTMARVPELLKLAKKLNLKIISIEDLIKFRLKNEQLITKEVTVDLPTEYGQFSLTAYREKYTEDIHLALKKGDWQIDEAVLVRVHSSCLTGDVLDSLRCDCGEQLKTAMQVIAEAGKGLVLYMNQEGRGIGLINKLKAYKLQEQGMDTAEANIALGFKMDQRDYGVGAQILRDQNIKRIKLLTNNPKKRIALDAYGLEIVENIPIEICPNIHNHKYLKTKKEKFGHNLKLTV